MSACTIRHGGDWLKAMGALGVGTLLSGLRSDAQAPTKPFRIDVHNHIVPPVFVQLLKDGGMWTPSVSNWSPAKAIEDLDKMGAATAITSLPNPHAYPVGQANVKLARDINEYAARLASDHPGRFGNFASLPLPDMDATLKEIAYALDVLKADGFFVWTNYEDVWLGDPAWAPIYEELNRRKAIVYTHPRTAACCTHPQHPGGRRHHRMADRHHARACQRRLLRHRREISQHPLHLVAWRGNHAVPRAPPHHRR